MLIDTQLVQRFRYSEFQSLTNKNDSNNNTFYWLLKIIIHDMDVVGKV